MTTHGARMGAEEPVLAYVCRLDVTSEVRRLAVAYPAFRFDWRTVGRHGTCWIAERKNGLHDGLHTLITANLAELHAALESEQARRSAEQEAGS